MGNARKILQCRICVGSLKIPYVVHKQKVEKSENMPQLSKPKAAQSIFSYKKLHKKRSLSPAETSPARVSEKTRKVPRLQKKSEAVSGQEPELYAEAGCETVAVELLL